MTDIREELKKKAEIIEAALDRYLPPSSAFPPLIHQAMRYSVMGGGKRLRPSLVMAGAEAVGGTAADVLSAACAVELIHVYSLIHDDLPAMDNDDFRRGKLTSHRVFGEAVAVLAGDALLTLAFQLLAENKAGCPGDVLKVLYEAALGAGTGGLIGGQIVDTFSAGEDIDESTLKYIHRNKTGALYRIAIRTGAILAGAREEELEALSRYAEHLGLAFQIKDDILDLEGEENKIGKPVGSDLKNSKATYPALFGLEKSREKARLECDGALAALSGFGQQADFLRLLVQFVINRDY
jgi:geranylgeranyl diphosphate synthase type II